MQLPSQDGFDALSVEQRRAVVIRALAAVTDRDAETIADDVPLAALGFDSLMFTSLLLEIEEDLGVELPVDVLADVAEAGRFSVVGDLMKVLPRGTT